MVARIETSSQDSPLNSSIRQTLRTGAMQATTTTTTNVVNYESLQSTVEVSSHDY